MCKEKITRVREHILGGACTEEQRGRYVVVNLYPLFPVPEKAINPVTDAWVNIHIQLYIKQFNWVYCIECRTEIHEQNAGICICRLKMVQNVINC